MFTSSSKKNVINQTPTEYTYTIHEKMVQIDADCATSISMTRQCTSITSTISMSMPDCGIIKNNKERGPDCGRD